MQRKFYTSATALALYVASPTLATRLWAASASAPASAPAAMSAAPATTGADDFVLSAEELAVVQEAEAYVVKGKAPTLPPPGVAVEVTSSSYAVDLASAVDQAPGARAVKQGGPMARAELRVRGLGGPRLAITLDGVPLDDAAGGQLDLATLDSDLVQSATLWRGPEAGTLAPSAIGGTLALRTAVPSDGVKARARLEVGSEALAAVSSLVGLGNAHGGAALALRLGRSEGNFSYRPMTLSSDTPFVGASKERLNNDQLRSGATLTARYGGESWRASALGHYAHHEGGVAGLSGHPTPAARQESDLLLAGGRGELFAAFGAVATELSGRVTDARYRSGDAVFGAQESHTRLTSGRVALDGNWLSPLPGLDLALGGELDQCSATPLPPDEATALDATASARTAAAAALRARWAGFEERLALNASARLDAISDVGVEPSLAARVAWALRQDLVVELYGGRAFRAPTFYEKFGPPAGYMSANPKLVPEVGFEGGVLLRLKRAGAQAELTAFGARLDNTIVYLNRNAYEIRPENAGSVWRAGGELMARLQATRLLAQSASVELVYSRMDVTGAPLPTTPLVNLRSRTELTLADVVRWLPLRTYLDLSARSQSAGNFYGELWLPAQASLDAGAALQLGAVASLAIEAHNLLDTRTLVDLHQVPLPGRQLLATLTLGV